MKTGAARRLDPESQTPTPESFLEEIQAIINSGTLRGRARSPNGGSPCIRIIRSCGASTTRCAPTRCGRVLTSEVITSDPRPNYEWLKKNAGRYSGKWVGPRRG